MIEKDFLPGSCTLLLGYSVSDLLAAAANDTEDRMAAELRPAASDPGRQLFGREFHGLGYVRGQEHNL